MLDEKMSQPVRKRIEILEVLEAKVWNFRKGLHIQSRDRDMILVDVNDSLKIRRVVNEWHED